jgi:hypothetical protein
MTQDFVLKVESRLSERINEDMAHHLISAHLSNQAAMDRETAHQIVMRMIPDIVAQVGLSEGLKIGQEIKDIYKTEFL